MEHTTPSETPTVDTTVLDVTAVPRRDVPRRDSGQPAHVERGKDPGTIERIGRYTVLEEIGCGGMGRVFLAEQRDPIEQLVAVKLMKASLAGPRSLARFSAERQTMARLGHANVARIFDGGTTEDGNPFFVMEYLPGTAITEYADQNRLSIEERLRLFLGACAGIQHAHLNQILHRDLKPSNIMVTEIDGEPMVKIIDFGIAKALGEPLHGPTMATGSRIMGTPVYMSPEALGTTESGEPRVDARTDVYSSGIVLYELLVGALPFEPSGGIAAMFRMICEEESPALSRRALTLTDAVRDRAAAARRIDPTELFSRFRDDLDWIVQKAIAKNPDERYVSAAELAADIERHLRDEPVLAGPRTWRYRFSKLVRRNRLTTAVACVALVALFAGIIGTTFGFIRARHQTEVAQAAQLDAERARLESEEVSDFLITLFEVSDPDRPRDSDVTARELLGQARERIDRELLGQPLVRGRFLKTIGRIYTNLALYEEADPLLTEALAIHGQQVGPDHPETAESHLLLGNLRHSQGYYKVARESFLKAYEILIRSDPQDDLRVAQALYFLGLIERNLSNFNASESYLLRALELYSGALDEGDPELVPTLSALGSLYRVWNDMEKAEALLQRALKIFADSTGKDHLPYANVLRLLASVYRSQGHFADAESSYLHALEIIEGVLGSEHPQVATVLQSLATLNKTQGRYEQAESLFRRALAIQEKALGSEHPVLAATQNDLGTFYWDLERYDEAEVLYLRSLRIKEKSLGPKFGGLGPTLNNLGLIYWKRGDFVAAESHLRRALALIEPQRGPDHPLIAWPLWGLAGVHRDQGHYDQAEPLYLRALEIRRAALPAGHADIEDTIRDYAELLRRMGRERDAAELLGELMSAN